MGKSTQQVQGTNDFSTVSKCSMVQYKYFEDDFILEFVPRGSHTRRAPLINMGYLVRAVAIDSTLHSFLRMTAGQPAQIVSCGAGFDSSYFRLKSKGALHSGITYYELDFPEVVQRKASCIRNSQLLSDNVVGHISDTSWGVKCDSYRLVAGDLCELEKMERMLSDAGLDFTLPTLLLAECSITYMDETRSSELILWAAEKFHNCMFVTYEQVYPGDGFGLVMQRHFESLGSPLQSVKVHPSLTTQVQRYKTRGWTSCTATSAFDVFMHETTAEERMRILSLEPFDEFEEWHLKCCHYTLTIASKGSLDNQTTEAQLHISNATDTLVQRPVVTWTLCDTGQVNRFCHKSVTVPNAINSVGNSAILVVGGFGCSSTVKSGHRRLSEIALLSSGVSVSQQVDVTCTSEENVTLDCMYHTCTRLSDTCMTVRILLYGGRTSPTKVVNVQPVLLSMKKGESHIQATVLATTRQQLWTPKPRWRHSAVRLNTLSMEQDHVLVFGGRTCQLEVLGDLWLLTISNLKPTITFREVWHSGTASGPSPRMSHSAVSLTDPTGGMIVSGGLGGHDLQPLNDLWLWNNTLENWQELVLQGPEMLPRYGHTSLLYQGQLVLVGGVNTIAGKHPAVAVVHLERRICVEFALPDQDPEHPILLHNHSSEQVGDDSTLVIIGGGGNCFSFGTAFNQRHISIDLCQFVHEDGVLI